MASSSSSPLGRTYNVLPPQTPSQPPFRTQLTLPIPQDAIDALNTLQTPHSVIAARRAANVRPDAHSLAEMRAYLSRIGYSPSDLDRLHIIHVAGTKGKGSTCAFVDSILARQTHPRPLRVGLFTSPHLIAVRERIRISSRPISEELFARYFFQVWDRLGEDGTKPIYARYLTLMSWHVFLEEGVDVAVYETGIGGEYDATNVVERPAVTGISTLGIDHVYVLGKTVEEIAWHKGGIMKSGRPAFSVEQGASAEEVLRRRAEEKGVELKVLGVDRRLEGVRVRPDAVFQKRNATLAVALAETALKELVPGFRLEKEGPLPKEFVEGLEQVVWRGRCEVKEEEDVTWYVDGAHTVDSLKMAARWFTGESAERAGPKVLIFNQQGRSEAIDFLDGLCNTVKKADPAGRGFEHVIFCTNVTYAETGYKRGECELSFRPWTLLTNADFVNHQYDPKDIEKMTAQHAFAEKWAKLDPEASIMVIHSIEEAINTARGLSKDVEPGQKVQALITGSLHLVGGALGILEKADAL